MHPPPESVVHLLPVLLHPQLPVQVDDVLDLRRRPVEATQLPPDALLLAHLGHHTVSLTGTLGNTGGYLKIRRNGRRKQQESPPAVIAIMESGDGEMWITIRCWMVGENKSPPHQ